MRILNVKKIVFSWILLLSLVGKAKGQNDSISNWSKQILPFAFYLPETSVGIGVASLFEFGLAKRDSGTAEINQFQFGGAVTLNRQLLVYLPFRIYSNNKNWLYTGETGYYRYTFNFYGVGRQAKLSDEEMYNINFAKTEANIMYRFFKGFYMGLGMRFHHNNMAKTASGGILEAGMVTGSTDGVISGIGPSLVYDNRDDQQFPSRGWLLSSSYLIHRPALFSSYNFEWFELDAATYQSLGKGFILAENIISQNSRGAVPFQVMPRLGGPKNIRGFYDGRYIDHHALIGQIELRKMVWPRIGFAMFYATGNVAPQFNQLFTSTFLHTGGGGIRLRLSKKSTANVRADVGFSEDGPNFYVTLREAF